MQCRHITSIALPETVITVTAEIHLKSTRSGKCQEGSEDITFKLGEAISLKMPGLTHFRKVSLVTTVVRNAEP